MSATALPKDLAPREDEPPKGEAGETVTELVRRTAAGQNGEVAVEVVVDGYRYLLRRVEPDPAPSAQLSPREQEIARMVAEGLPNKTIAAVLEISSWTVGTHLRRIFAKLGVSSRAAMVAKLMEHGPRTR